MAQRTRKANPNFKYRVMVGRSPFQVAAPSDGATTTTVPCQECTSTVMTFRSYNYAGKVGWELVCNTCQENHQVYTY